MSSADAGVPRKYRILKFVVGSFGIYSVLVDDSILDPSYDPMYIGPCIIVIVEE